MAALMFLIVFESSVPEPQQVKRKCGGREFSRFCFQVNQTLLILPCQGPTSWGAGPAASSSPERLSGAARSGRRETHFPSSARDPEGRKVELAHFTEEETEVQRNHTAHQQ